MCVANSAATALALINCVRAPRTVMIFIAPRDRQQGKPFQLSACKFLSWYQVIFPKCKAPTHAHAPHYTCAAEVAATSQDDPRSEEHTSALPSLMRTSYAVFCLKKKNKTHNHTNQIDSHTPTEDTE